MSLRIKIGIALTLMLAISIIVNAIYRRVVPDAETILQPEQSRIDGRS